MKKRVIKIILLTLGAVTAAVFILPAAGGIFNIGSVVGIASSLLLVLCGAFMDKILQATSNICSSGRGRALLLAASVVPAAVVMCFFAALFSTVSASVTTAEGQNTVIVLGCAVYGEKPSSMLNARIEAAYEYLAENPGSIAVLAGGQGSDEDISEAQCMFNILTGLGIDVDRLILEDKSTDTNENISFSKKLIEQNGLSRSVAIVTSDFHLKRAMMIAKKNGLSAAGISAESGRFSLPVFYVRDTLGVIKEFLFALRIQIP